MVEISFVSNDQPGSEGMSAFGDAANTADPVRVAAIVVIFVVSLCAAGFPTAAQRIRFLKVPSLLFFLGKHFGTGVILSTAFIHLLSDAFTSLQGANWLGYTNWPGAIILFALLAIFLVEYCSTVYVESVAHTREASDKTLSPNGATSHLTNGSALHSSPHSTHRPVFPTEGARRSSIASETTPLIARRGSQRDAYFDVYMHHHDHPHPEGHCSASEDHKDATIQLLGVVVLQIGIMLHSFVIGMTLAVTSLTHLPSLLTAILFHQLFEGLSLGVRLASLPPSLSSPANPRGRSIRWLPPLLIFLFGATTPLGIIIGLILKHVMKVNGMGAFFAPPTTPGGSHFRGIMSSVSAGLLIYAGCVELLAGDFVMDTEMRKAARGRQILAIGSLMAGALGMALIK